MRACVVTDFRIPSCALVANLNRQCGPAQAEPTPQQNDRVVTDADAPSLGRPVGQPSAPAVRSDSGGQESYGNFRLNLAGLKPALR